MDIKLEEKLVKKYPSLYSTYGGDIKKTCMGWGMTCGDGWYKLLDELSSKLEPLGVVAAQVKEKFGGLRFYLEGCNNEVFDEAHEHISKAEDASYNICETCGQAGKVRPGGWVSTACDKCDKLYKEGKTPNKNPEEFGLEV